MGLLAGHRLLTPSFLLLMLLIGFTWLSPPSVAGLRCYSCPTTHDCDDLGKEVVCSGDKMCSTSMMTSEDGHIVVMKRECAGNSQIDVTGCKKLETGFKARWAANKHASKQRCLCSEDLCNEERAGNVSIGNYNSGQSSRQRPHCAMILGGVATTVIVTVAIMIGGGLRHRP